MKTYNIKSAIDFFTSAWIHVKMTTLSNSCEKLMLDEDPDLDLSGFELNDCHQTLLCAGERSQCQICQKQVGGKRFRQWLPSPFYRGNCRIGSGSDSEDKVVVRQKMSQVPDCINTLIQYVDVTNYRDIQGFYEHLHTLRELIIRQQYQRGKQLKLDSFFNFIYLYICLLFLFL